MSHTEFISDSLYTNTNKFLIVFDSRNSTTNNNGTLNSDVIFQFEEPIIIPKGALKMTCSVMAFTCPNSLYNVNVYNNYLHIKYGTNSTELKIIFHMVTTIPIHSCQRF